MYKSILSRTHIFSNKSTNYTMKNKKALKLILKRSNKHIQKKRNIL